MRRIPKLILILVLAFLPLNAIGAQNRSDIVISPVIIDHTIEPNSSYTNGIVVTNNTDVTREFQIETVPFEADQRTGSPVFTPGLTSSLTNWIQLDKTLVTIAPDDKESISFNITVPQDTLAGTYQVAIFASDTVGQGEGNADVAGRLGTLLFITVAGENFVEINSLDFQPAYTLVNVIPEQLFETKITNAGNTYIQPEGAIAINLDWGLSQQSTYQLEFNPAGQRVLGKSTRYFTTASSNIVNNGFNFGKYTAKLAFAYGSTNEVVTTSISFYVFPWKLTLILISTLLGLFLLRLGYRRLSRAAN